MKNTSKYPLSYRIIAVGLGLQLGAVGYTIYNPREVRENPEIHQITSRTANTGILTTLAGLSIGLIQFITQRPKPRELEQVE